MFAKINIFALLLASLLLDTAVNAHDVADNINTVANKSLQLTYKAAMAQKGFLEKKRSFAQYSSDVALELDTIRKLELIKGRDSLEYLFASISYNLRQGGKLRSQALADIKKLCNISPLSYECVQSKALAEITDPYMRLQLQSFVMHENNADYAQAVADLDKLFPNKVVVEHGLRLRYYTMMGNIDGREREAALGLRQMLDEIPYDNEQKISIKQLANSFESLGLANSAIARIDDPKYVKSAQNDLRRAIALDPNHSAAKYWQEILSSSVYYRTVDKGDLFLARSPKAAVAHYKEAIKAEPNSPYAYVGLCRAYAALKDEHNFFLYAPKALRASSNESVAEQKRIRRVINALEADFYVAKAERARDRDDTNAAKNFYAKVLRITRNDPWLYYHLASLEAQGGNNAKAQEIMDSAPLRLKHDPEYAHAKALILDRCGQSKQALALLRPYIAKDSSLKRTYERIDNALRVDEASSLYKQGSDKEALALIKDIDTPRTLALKSDIMQRAGNRSQAIDYAEQSLALDKSNTYVLVGLCSLYHEDGQNSRAKECADELKKRELTLDERRNLGQLYLALGDKEQAQDVFRKAIADSKKDENVGIDSTFQEKDQDLFYSKAWTRRELASTYTLASDISNELRYALGDLDGKDYSDDIAYTTALRTPDEKEDWLRSSIRRRGDEAYLKNTVIIEDGFTFLRDSGHPGYSDNKGYVNVLKISFPLFDGRAVFQTDRVFMDPGALSGGPYDDMFGTIFVDGTDDTGSRSRSTNTYAFSYSQDNWTFDIGTAPKVSQGGRGTTLVGGASIDFDLGNWTLSPRIFRRALDKSVLSYFGERDCRTGTYFGAVKENGIGLSGSYYLGPQDGLWFDSSLALLKGTNVQDNYDLTMMGGYYHHLIDKPNERLTIAPSAMFMHYAHDLNGYTLGQGGYYSPQLYLSSSLTLRYMRRHENYSYLIEGSGSLAYARKNAEARYPIKNLVPQSVEDRDAYSDGDSSISFGFGLRAALERRISSRLVVGGGMSYSRSDDYSPFNFLLYFRYYCTDYFGDLYMPPSGPVPYTKW